LRLEDEAGRTRALALAFRATSRHRLLAPFSRALWLEALPVLVGEDSGGLVAEFLRQLKAFASRAGDVELFVGSHASGGGAAVLGEAGFDIVRRLEFRCSLNVSEESLWAALGTKPRNHLKKASRCGVTVCELAGEEAVAELRRLQRASATRIVQRGGPDITPRAEASVDPVSILLESGIGRVLAARFEGTYVSAGLFTCFNGLVHYTLSGHTEAGLRSQGPTLVLWEALKRYREAGARSFNLGGCGADAVDEHSPEHGVYVYKRSLASECIECASGRAILRRRVHRIVGGLRRVTGGVFAHR
jgi:hypothetical protein